jgi:anti-sigma-K factor RskA
MHHPPARSAVNAAAPRSPTLTTSEQKPFFSSPRHQDTKKTAKSWMDLNLFREFILVTLVPW